MTPEGGLIMMKGRGPTPENCMSIWNKVLVGLIAVAVLPLIYMTARVLHAQTAWSKSAFDHQAAIDNYEKLNRDLKRGNVQREVDLNNLLLDRRRAWAGCDPMSRKPNRNAGTAEITVTIPAKVDEKGKPIGHGIAERTVLYAFEELKPQNKGTAIGDFDVGQYLGEFAVTAVKGNEVTFKPTFVMTPTELDRLVKAMRPWLLYELLPQDSHEVFASLDDKDKKAMLPPESLRDYLKDGKPAEKDDPPDRVVDGKYVRPLIDYSVVFNDEHQKRMLLNDAIASLQRDKQLALEALDQARTLADAVTKEIASTKTEKEEMQRQRDIVATYGKNLEKNLGDMEAWIARLTKTNHAMAGRIAKLQLEAAKRIDQRTREMAQSGTGRL